MKVNRINELIKQESLNSSVDKDKKEESMNSSLDTDKRISDFDSELILEKLLHSSDEFSTNYQVDENSINEKRAQYLDEKITPQFLSLIKEEDFEFGQRSKSINLVEEQLQTNTIATQNWFNKLYLYYFRADEKILLSLLKVVEYLDKELFFPTGQTMAISALSHKNDEIKEMGVRIFENWCSIESYEMLKNLKVETIWLQKYIDQVVKDLEEELCLI